MLIRLFATALFKTYLMALIHGDSLVILLSFGFLWAKAKAELLLPHLLCLCIWQIPVYNKWLPPLTFSILRI